MERITNREAYGYGQKADRKPVETAAMWGISHIDAGAAMKPAWFLTRMLLDSTLHYV